MVILKCFGIPDYHLATFEIKIPHSVSLETLLNEFLTQVEGDLTDLLLHNKALRKGIYILVNGRAIDGLSGFKTAIKPGDEIVISKILVGG